MTSRPVLLGGLGACVAAALALGLVGLASGQAAAAVAGAALGLGVALAGPRAAARLTDDTWGRAGAVAVGALGLFGLAWALAFDSMQTSDFGVYWRCGTGSAPSLAAWLEACQSKYMAPTPLFWLRSLLYTTPFGAVAGASPRALDAYNALLHAASLALLFAVARRPLGAPAATVAVVAWGVFPERLFAITLATSDNLAALLVVVVLALAARDEGHPGLRALALGLSLAALEVLRNTGLLFSAGVVLAALASPAQGRARRAGVAVGAAALGLLLTKGLVFALPGSWHSVGAVRAFSALDLTSLQTFDVALRWYDHVLPAVPEAVRTRFALDTLVTELGGHGGLYPAYLLAKSKFMFTGGGYAGWAALALPSNPDTALTVAAPSVPRVPGAVLAALLAFVVALAGVGAVRARRRGLLRGSLAVTATFFAAVLLFLEAQPRYLFVVGPALVLLAAGNFAREDAPRDFAVARGSLVLAAAALLFAAWTGWVSRRPAPLAAARAVAEPACGGAAVVRAGLQRLRVELPVGVTCATVRVPLGREASRVRLVVTQASFPFPFEPRVDPGLDWVLSMPAATRSGRLGAAVAEYVELDGWGAEVTLRVTRTTAATPAALELAHLAVP